MIVTEVTDFLTEAANRLKTKSPKFFSILQGIGVAVILMGYSPWAINRYTAITLPDHFITLCNDIAKYGTGFLLSALFAVRTKPVAQTESGEAVKVVNDKKMPLTAKDEAKIIENTVPPPPVVHNVPLPEEEGK